MSTKAPSDQPPSAIMDSNFDISDSTDWVGTALSGLGPVDAALRCQVCKDYFNTAMITSCSHTFCSLCIRRSLAADGQCPTCRAGEREVRLRRNWTVQEVVDAFIAARAAALDVAKRPSVDEIGISSQDKRGSKRKRKDASLHMEEEDADRRAPRTRGERRRATAQSPEPSVAVVDVEEQDGRSEPDDGLVACPMCGKRMKEQDVFAHLDRCEDEMKQPSRNSKSASSTSTPLQRPPSPPSTQAPPERLPQLNYSLLNENGLRKKFKDLGIPAWGPKQLLTRRHTEWTNLWNANCDAQRPRPKRDLLSELDAWERAQGGLSAGGGISTGPSAVMRKDFDGAGWARRNRDDFDLLIASARQQQQQRRPTGRTGDSDVEADAATSLENSAKPPPPLTSAHDFAPPASGTPAAPSLPWADPYTLDALHSAVRAEQASHARRTSGGVEDPHTAKLRTMGSLEASHHGGGGGGGDRDGDVGHATSSLDFPPGGKEGDPYNLPSHFWAAEPNTRTMPMFEVPKEGGEGEGGTRLGNDGEGVAAE